MVEHAIGDETSRPRAKAEVASEPSPSVEHAGGDINAWRQAYNSAEYNIVVPQSAKAGVGFYPEYFGGDLFAPPVEFGGYPFNNATFSPFDPYSNPARYGNNYGYGYLENDGWSYHKGGQTDPDHRRIAQCMLLYKSEGIIQTIVHLLADFVVESVDLVHKDATVHNFYKAWQTKVKLKERLHRFVVDLLQSGNVFIWTREAKLKQGDRNAMKRGVAARLIGGELVVELEGKNKKLRDKAIHVEVNDDVIRSLEDLSEACHNQATKGEVSEVAIEQAQGDSRNDPANPDSTDRSVTIPWDYVSLNPLQMAPRGSRFANEHYWVMLLNKRDLRPLSKFMSYRYYNDISTTKVNLPEIFKGKLQPAPQGSPYAAELKLDPKRLSVIQDVTKADYEDWATPQIYPAHKEVSFKRLMRQAEVSAMESLKHSITLIKLGDVKAGFQPTPEQIDRVAAALAGGAQAHHLVWDDLIQGEVLQPDIGRIMDPKKYEQVDKDIYAALGVAQSVMTGNGSYANSFMSIKLLLEKLETIRCKLEDWLQTEVKKIADVLKFRKLPEIQWGLMNLRDENAERKLWIELYDRGIVSDASILQRFGSDFDIEAERQKYEKAIKEKENPDAGKQDDKFRAPVMVSRGPFNRDLQKNQKTGGRPVKTGTPQQKKRNTKPQGMGSLIKFQQYFDFAQASIKTISNVVTKKVVAANSVKDFRSLSKDQKFEVEHLILNVLAATNPDSDKVNENLVYDILSGKRFAREDIVEFYQDEVLKADTKDERLALMSNVFAAVHADLLRGTDEETTRTD